VGPSLAMCCSAPLPQTSPVPLQTAPHHPQQDRRFCTIHHCRQRAYGNIQVKRRKAIAAERPAKVGEVAPQTEEHLGKPHWKTLHRRKHPLTLSGL